MMMWPEMTERERYYDACEAIEHEREDRRREMERKYGPKPCPICGERYEHVEGCSEAHKPKESDA